MRLFAVCPGQEDLLGAREVHRVVDLARQLAYEAEVIHLNLNRAFHTTSCTAVPGDLGLSDFPDSTDTVVLVRNEDVLEVLDVSLGRVTVWWVEVVDFPVLLERVAESSGLGKALPSLVHGPTFTHVAATAPAGRYLAGEGATAGRLDAQADDAALRQQIFDVIEQHRVSHLTSAQWVK